MKITLSNPKSTAITGVILALPFTLIFLSFLLGMEPNLGFLDSYQTAGGVHPGSFIDLSFLLLLIAGFIINVVLIVRSVRAGKSLTENPFNLAIAVLTLFINLAFIVAIIVDQYPCWIGVPNCD